MFKSLFKWSPSAKNGGELPKPVRGGMEELVGVELEGDRIPLAALHAQFDTVGQKRRVDNSRTVAMVKVTHVPHQG
ncbi:hypothetical protein [Acuticoccus sediminis]|uniref:hypothetical protein n=1 Tax=Acuticoccus sediminis TaxID=2184697 RepID=UPI001CFDDF8E|nr:hypothetical protein [Acuticoccus sediminis]